MQNEAKNLYFFKIGLLFFYPFILQIIGRGPRSDLKITPLNLEFYGRYTCKAKNPHGEAEHEIELHEAREPSFVQQVK